MVKDSKTGMGHRADKLVEEACEKLLAKGKLNETDKEELLRI
jgi:hypothetical protein